MKIALDKPFTHGRSLSVPAPDTPPLEALGFKFPGSNSSKSTLELPQTPVTPPPEYQEHSFLHNDRAVDVAPEVGPDDQPLVAVVGVGYVGTHLVDSFSAHYDVLGFDVSEGRISEARKELPGERIRFTTCRADLREATHFLISVPTLLKADKSIDTSYLRSAIATVAQHARPGSTVVIESSVAVGMTRGLLGPVALSRGFYAGMSPERVDPGRVEPPCRAIPKIVSGLDDGGVPGSLASIVRLYGRVFDRLVPVSRTEVAEMTKLYENCQRMMCVAFANEMADACLPHGIDPYEVAAAAATKPFGYTPFAPSLGVGGHCIPVNPYYLLSNSAFPLLEAAAEKMAARPAAIARRAIASLTTRDAGAGAAPAALLRPRVLVVGVGFKAGQSVLSNSPGVDLVHALVRSGEVDVMFADPLVRQNAVPSAPRLADENWNRKTLETFDMIIVSFRQRGLDFGVLEELRGVRVEMWCA
ncbi:nucleotide sugar dehydrogenase [Colletotrichum falcatum]|nr:nucleotide sugar dehydrogenase [Colletotrichum falcatum]